MGISINEITSGIALKLNQDIYMVTDYNHVKPGKGSAFVRVKLRNVKTQQVLERTFRSAEKLEDVAVEEKRLQSLYSSGDAYHFMDLENYEELVISKEMLGDATRFLLDNQEVAGLFHHDEVLKINLPNFIVFEIKHTEPGIKGDSSRAGNKPAEIDTGAAIQVPLFINIGDKVKIDTRTGEYVERV